LDARLELAAEEITLDALVREAISQITPLAETRSVQINFAETKERTIAVPKALLVSAIATVLENAVQIDRPAGREPSTVDVHISTSGRAHVIRIRDKGTGVDAAVLASLFEGSASTKGRPAAGLAIAREQLALLRGTIALESTDGNGTTFAISLPGL